MKYNDLKKFKEICKSELPPKYFYQDPDTDIAAHWIFTKIRANGTCMSESYAVNGTHANYHEGIWIDIFPLIDAADTLDKLGRQLNSIFEYQHNLFLRQPISKDMSIPAKVITLITNIKGKILLYKNKKGFERLQATDSPFSIAMSNFFYAENTEESRKKALTEIVLPKELVPSKYVFEGLEFCGFSEYNRYLTEKYGPDYMTPSKWSHIPNYEYVTL